MKHLRLLVVLMLALPLVVSAQATKGTKKGAKPAVETVQAPPPPPPKAAQWEVDAAHSYVTFSVRHFFTPVPGGFDKFTGLVHFDAENLANSSVDFTVDVTSVNTKIEKRDAHLKSADFFNADTFATMRFVSTSIEKTGDNTFVAKGKFTAKNVTKDMDVPFTYLGSMDHPWKPGALVGGIKAGFTFKRTEFGIGTGNWVQTSVVGDDVTVDVNLELTRTK